MRDKNFDVARIAMVALQELEDNNLLDFLLIRDNELREWWAEQKQVQAQTALLRSGWKKLTQEETIAITAKLFELFNRQSETVK